MYEDRESGILTHIRESENFWKQLLRLRIIVNSADTVET